MKVSTIACIFGALIDGNVSGRVLDVGTGTGLLSMMLAQKAENALIDAIEIDESAFIQAKDNFEKSKWREKLRAIKGDFLSYDFKSKYHLIVSNPPFFNNHLKTTDSTINLARHRDHFSLDRFCKSVNSILLEEGQLWVLLPEYDMELLAAKLETFGYFINRKINIYDKEADQNCIVRAQSFSKRKVNEGLEKFVIKNKNGSYTDQFIDYLKSYYLYL